MSNQGPTTDTTKQETSAAAPKASGQFVLDLNTLGTLRGKLRSTKATPAPVPTADAPAPVRVEAAVVEKKPLTVTVTVKNTHDLPKPVAKQATIRQAAPKAAATAPVPPVRKESLVNKNLGRPLPAAPKKQSIAADVPPPVPPRDDVAPTVVAVPPAPPMPPAPPKAPALPKTVATESVGVKPALLFSAADLAGKKLKKTVTVDKSSGVVGKQVAQVAVQQPVAAVPGAIATSVQRAAPASTGNAFDDELKARLAKRMSIKVQ